MKHRILTGLFLLAATPALLLGQSLTELAKEEKERRRRNKESGKEVKVITDRELAANAGTIANPADSASGVAAEGATQSPRSATVVNENGEASRRSPINDELEEEEEAPVTEIPAEASLEQKLSLLERMKTSYQQQVSKIDTEVRENNQRLADIQEELVSTGGTGLPTAPQADRSPRNPANIPGLRNEQQELRQKNQALEAQKQSLKDDIIAKGRRAGIPPGYLNF